MYDEFERAVTGKSKPGLSFLGGVAIALGIMLVLGVVGIGFAVKRTVHRVEQLAHDFAENLDIQPALVAAEMADRLQSHARLASAGPEDGLAFLESLDAGDPSESLLRNMADGIFVTPAHRQDGHDRHEHDAGSEDGASVVINSDGEEVRLDLQRSDGGGSLVIDTDDGQVRLDLMKTEDGGYLSIDSDDGQVRFDLVRTDDGGFLTIDSDDGQVRFDLSRGEGGGELRIQTDDETFRFALGDQADAMPGWVPRMDGMPSSPQRVYSLDSEDGFLGAVAWQAHPSPDQIMGFYQEVLEDQGYEFRASHRAHGNDFTQRSLWARHEDSGRIVFVVAHDDRGETEVLLGYGQGD